MLEAVRLYVQGLPSYRTLATIMGRRLGRPVSRVTLNAWVDDLGGAALTPVEVSAALSPTWGGYLGVDGKAIFVSGQERCLLVGVDQVTQDVIHALVVEAETEDAFERLVREAVTVAHYPLKGLVSDASPPFLAAHANYFPRVPLQLLTHHRVNGLPADANITENVIKQLGKKLRLMEGFATMDSAERFCRLLIGSYRFKRFTDSCRRDDNGKSPLELAGVDLAGVDWLRFLLQR